MARILLVDDNAAVRRGYRGLLARTPSHEVVGEAEDGDEVLAGVGRLRPDLVVMDVDMRRVGGLAAARLLRETYGECPKVLMSSLHGDDRLVAEALRVGARGYILKATAAVELVTAIDQVISGHIFVSRRVREAAVSARPVGESLIERELVRRLTPAEGRLFTSIGGGRSDDETCLELGLSRESFDGMLRQLIGQLALRTRAELIELAQPRLIGQMFEFGSSAC